MIRFKAKPEETKTPSETKATAAAPPKAPPKAPAKASAKTKRAKAKTTAQSGGDLLDLDGKATDEATGKPD